MEAVYELLQGRSARDLTMEMVAKRAKVGKPTLYKWWPTKGALILAMFAERIHNKRDPVEAATAEQTIRNRVRRLIGEFNGLFGKVMAGLIAEGQSEPAILKELYQEHMWPSRAAAIAELERGKADGEFHPDINSELLVDAIIGPIYFRLLLRSAPLTEEYGEALVDQVLLGLRSKSAGVG
ncbi:TetR/AcrR family transcriptional regulator [Mesorhizobium sp. BH1-1-4]|uniref:TetR/AcrR family transcriptional regulator n=1 Tax=Mesorhizobium sp. BH1-1-4 TaxID=2876662 RepID=UPI001CD0B5A7|nr:TetR/AcrR family transcriptional regulator [Mesorhizobium sp. BH1-1-4]MBZ9994915.1 TetR/AcrR family transcriptional regulator [Mesorhizobium sp. BH1-1-4]